MHIISLSSYNGHKLNSLLTYFQKGFIAQSVEQCTGIVEVMGSNLIKASDFFLGFLCNCLSCFTNAKITFTSILLVWLLRVPTCFCGFGFPDYWTGETGEDASWGDTETVYWGEGWYYQGCKNPGTVLSVCWIKGKGLWKSCTCSCSAQKMLH